MEFRILGPLEVVADGKALDVGGPKQRAVLAMLLLEANRVVSLDRLIEGLWDENPPEKAQKALQVYISQLRKLLGRERLQTKAPGYLLRVELDQLDLARFQRLQDEGRLHEALSLWRGPPLSDFAYQRFAQAEIERLEELRLVCLEERIQRDLAGGLAGELVGEVEALVREHPLRERLRAQLMLALYRSGRQAEALEAYQAARHALVEELGIEPGRSLRDLEKAILEQDASLDVVSTSEEAGAGAGTGPGQVVKTRVPVAQLPGGTVTFVFTDIEGSTRLLHRLGDRYAETLAQHRKLLRAAFSSAGGVEVETQGDAFMLAFVRARDAVAAASAAQRALAEHAWPDGAELRVRMGVHTGDAALSEGGYVGLDIHRGARICAASHGGQVVLSQTTRELLGEEFGLRDLGEHRLKDMPGPDRLFQLVVPDLPSAFPPLRSLTVTNVPTAPTPLVGREAELAALLDLLGRDRVRLVTLTGPGGTGKTRLALEVAGELVSRYPGGVFFIGLASVGARERVLPEIAGALGVREPFDVTFSEGVKEHLGDRRVLLVLDNFEQVIPAAPLLSDLLASCPGLKVVVTSRERLHLNTEVEYPVPPLPEDDAVALFSARAAAVKPAFELTGDARSVVAEICRRVDGLPLALELAAARVRLLPLREILVRLDRRLAFLTAGARDLPERQQTLRATIDWSHELLGDDEQRLFARLAMFADGFTLEACEAVCGSAHGSVLDLLTSLCDKSLVVPQETVDERSRFVMLETIREYAAARLDDRGEAEAVRLSHAQFFARLAEEAEPSLTGPEQATWFRRLEEDHENLRAALGYARETGDTELWLRLVGAVWRFWFTHGHLSEGRRWLDGALAASGPAAGEVGAKALYGASVLASVQGDYQRARTLARQRLMLARELGDPTVVASALSGLANVESDAGEYDHARAHYEEAATLAQESGDLGALAGATTNLGYLALRQRDWARAAGLALNALPLFQQLGHLAGIAVSLLNFGFAAIHQVRWQEAVESLGEGLGIYAELGDRDGVSYCLEGLAAVAAARRDPERAATLLGAAAALRTEIGASLQPHERELHDATVAEVDALLGPAARDAAWASGGQLAVADSVRLGEETAGRSIAAPRSA